MSLRDVKNLRQSQAYQQGYLDAVNAVREQLGDSTRKILSMALDTEPYTSQRRMLLACTKLLEIYSNYYDSKAKYLEQDLRLSSVAGELVK